MRLYLDRLQPSSDLDLDVESQECDLPSEIGRFTAPIHLDAHVRKIEAEIFMTGRISTRIEMSCSRCLKLHEECLVEVFEVVYRPSPPPLNGEAGTEEIELDETDLNVSYYTGESIDIAELLREQLLLMLPVKPLCKADCLGLCPSCGKDLNEGPCTCSISKIDPRFAVLGQLLDLKESGENSKF